MAQQKLAFVTGATGGVGGEVAAALLRHGWSVRALTRDPARAATTSPDGIEFVAGDAMNQTDMTREARGAAIVFHGANPPGYRNWRGLAISMLRNAITAAQTHGARLIYPGSVYVYGPDARTMPDEDAPQNPHTRKGKIRVEMEAMLHAAAATGLRTLVVRAGDFFGPRAPSSWVSKVLLADGADLRAVVTPEVKGAAHAWAYLPDLAETIALLADREACLPPEARFHFAGHPLVGQAMAEAVQRVTGGSLPIKQFNWLPIYLAAPFVTFCREVIEMRWLWAASLQLDDTRLIRLLGAEPPTTLDRAVRTSINVLRNAPSNPEPASLATSGPDDMFCV